MFPLYKKDDRLNLKNYRPVTIVPILSKLLERIIFDQMTEHLSSNRLIHPNHHAFRAGFNTTTAMIIMYDGWVQAVESVQIADVVMLDNKLVNIQTPIEIITPSSKEKLSGCWVSDNMKWAEHIQDNKDSLILVLTARLGALKKIRWLASKCLQMPRRLFAPEKTCPGRQPAPETTCPGDYMPRDNVPRRQSAPVSKYIIGTR